MKDARDPGTIDMTLVPKRGRGRPSTGQAKSAAERMRAYRSRSVTVNRGVLEASLVDVGSHRNVTGNRVVTAQPGDVDVEFALDQVRQAENLALLVDNIGGLDADAQGYLDSLLGALHCAVRRLSAMVEPIR